MVIYQLHKYGGEYEDRYDYIIGSYLRKERAEEEKNKRELVEEEKIKMSRKCRSCPFLDDDFCLEDKNHEEYCDKAELTKDDKWGIYCNNCYYHFPTYFRIEEAEVEE